MSCCGNLICRGCSKEHQQFALERELDECCAFCRALLPSSEKEIMSRLQKRMALDDGIAIQTVSQCYRVGECGLPKDAQQAFELCLRAAALGNANACNSAASFYSDGVTIPTDMVKAREYFQKGVQEGGGLATRHHLGMDEKHKGNFRLASRHWLISAAAGATDSLEEISKSYKFQVVTKKEYSTAYTSNINVHKIEWSSERESVMAMAEADSECSCK